MFTASQAGPACEQAPPDGTHGVQCICVMLGEEVPRSRGWLEPSGWDSAEPGELSLWGSTEGKEGTPRHEK